MQIVALTGPSGAGKSAVIRVLANELDLEIVEWINPIESSRVFGGNNNTKSYSPDYDPDSVSTSQRFSDFLALARKASCGVTGLKQRKRIILVEDFPNLTSTATRAAFHAALRDYAGSSRSLHPLVLVITDTVVGSASSSNGGGGGGGGAWFRSWADSSMNLPTIVPADVRSLPQFHKISFNPCAPTYLSKALTKIIKDEIRDKRKHPAKDQLLGIVEDSGGDIRCAINTMQFLATFSGGVQGPNRQVGNVRSGGSGKERKFSSGGGGGSSSSREVHAVRRCV